MNRKFFAILALVFLLPAVASGQPQNAEGCYVGPGLAATLLFPYFEVDLGDPLGVGTLLSINNGGGGGELVRLVVWSDWGIPTLAFDLYLKPFDVETINVGDLFNGNIPSTGAGVDLNGIPGCTNNPTSHNNPALSAVEQAQLRADHLGQEGPILTSCAGASHGDSIGRGYITVDVVQQCGGIESGMSGRPSISPVSPTYFAEGGGLPGVADTANILWGDIIYVDSNNKSAQGSEAVPIWANPAQFVGTDRFTFYGRYNNWDGRDERVPLPSRWNQRFLNGGPFAGGADLIVWRDTGRAPFLQTCGGVPTPFPLKDKTFVSDLDGNGSSLAGDTHFPLAPQRVSIDSLGLPFTFGWLQISFNASSIGASGSHQAWVQPSLNASGLYSANFNGTPTEFLCSTDPTP